MSKSHCKKTGKVRYRSHEKALESGGKILGSKSVRTRVFYGYLCAFCKSYHLTSQPNRGSNGSNGVGWNGGSTEEES